MLKFLTYILLSILFCKNSNAQITIIPKPNEIKIKEGKCNYKNGLNLKVIRGDEPTKLILKQITDFLIQKKIPIITTASTSLSINLLQSKSTDTIIADAYSLNITTNNITISSHSNAGLFYGLQSLYQLINADSLKVFPCLEIKDEPAYNYRGFQLDVCQHFFGVEVIKNYLDAIAKLKFNQFIWKLADEQTCRIEIKNNPKLVETDTLLSREFYTQDEIKQIVDYAKERFLNIIPQINFAQIIVAGDNSFQYKKNILDEVFALFPSKYFNVDNPIFVTNEIEDYIKTKGKEIIGIDISTSKENIVVSCKNNTVGINAAKNGNNVIMAPHNLCSLDNYQNWDDSKLSRLMLFLPLDKVYKFDPVAKVKNDKIKQHIIGAQANVDTRFISSENVLSNQVYPRIFALAECFWTHKSNRKSFKDFSIRLEKIGYPGQITEKINLVKFK